MKRTENKNHESEIDDELVKPGEYGSPDKPRGWTSFEYQGRVIFLTSSEYSIKSKNEFSKKFYEQHAILSENTIDLRKIEESNTYVSENKVNATLEQFKKLIGTPPVNENILIHCKAGLNRTPVAAVIYLLKQGETRVQAEKIVNDALAKRCSLSNPETVNKRENFTRVLAAAELSMSSVTTSVSNSPIDNNQNSTPAEKMAILHSSNSLLPNSSSSSSLLVNNNLSMIRSNLKKPWLPIRKSEVQEVVREGVDFLKEKPITRLQNSNQAKNCSIDASNKNDEDIDNQSSISNRLN